ncbi:MAG: mobile mystery protein A [Candidatus Acidiferrales bacterium]
MLDVQAEFQKLRRDQIARSLRLFERARNVPRPRRGWLRTIRKAAGMTLREVAKNIAATPQLVALLEKSEAADKITLAKLRSLAAAMDCQLVYAILPNRGTIHDLLEHRARQKATEHVLAVEQTMALENQATGDLKKKIERETRRILKRAL